MAIDHPMIRSFQNLFNQCPIVEHFSHFKFFCTINHTTIISLSLNICSNPQLASGEGRSSIKEHEHLKALYAKVLSRKTVNTLDCYPPL